MVTHNIPFESLIPHGKVSISIDGEELIMTTNSAFKNWFTNDETPINIYLSLPDKYRLPFRIDMTLKIDSPAFYLLIGKGHVGFATGMDNRRVTDILGGISKPNTHFFDNNLIMDQYADISVTYGMKAMWVYVNNELRCISRNNPYIKAFKKGILPEEFKNGFNISLSCDKRTKMTLKSLTIVELKNEEISEPAEKVNINPLPVCLSVSEKPTLEECIQGLEIDLQKEIIRTNEYLLKDMKKNMTFKRKIEGGYPCSKITYVSPLGLSYKIHITGTILWHQLNWIRYNTKQEQEKYGGYKKADYTNEALKVLTKKSPELAAEIFYRIRECFGCKQNCEYRALYENNGKKKASCDDIFGGIHFKMFPSDFEDLRNFINAINNVIIK